jgi:hypothetical protein
MANETPNPIMTHQAELWKGGQHDTHLYDPGATQGDNPLMAVYPTVSDAAEARRRLLEAGVAGSAIDIVDRTGEQETGPRGGLWASVRHLLIADEDVAGRAEAAERGRAVLLVRPHVEQRADIVRLLEATAPIGFDARLEEWRSAGWNALAAQQAQTGGPDGNARTVASPGAPVADLAAQSAHSTAIGKQTDVIRTADTPGTSGAVAEDMTSIGRRGIAGAYDTATRPAERRDAETLGNAAQTTGAAAVGKG